MTQYSYGNWKPDNAPSQKQTAEILLRDMDPSDAAILCIENAWDGVLGMILAYKPDHKVG